MSLFALLWPPPSAGPATQRQLTGGFSVVALGLYEGELADQVRALKYRDETRWAGSLGARLGALVPPPWRSAALVPIPLHPAKLAARGYNQAALVARAVGRRANMPVSFETLARLKETAVQARLGRDARAANAAEAFVALPPRSERGLVLVDDVVTTGSTLESAALALRAEGHTVLGALALALATD
ncbi:MAG TPA: ComF family protein [Polyangiaceae bacterium]|nr:ComF family protein [Polyangiaceae bacterium]